MNKTKNYRKKRRKTQRRRRKMTGGIFGLFGTYFFTPSPIWIGKCKDGVGAWSFREVQSHEILDDNNTGLKDGLLMMGCQFITEDAIDNLIDGNSRKLNVDDNNRVFVLYYSDKVIGYVSCTVHTGELACYVKYECCNGKLALEGINREDYPKKRASLVMQAFLIYHMRNKYGVTSIYKELLGDENLADLRPLLYSLNSGFKHQEKTDDGNDLRYIGIKNGTYYSSFDISKLDEPDELTDDQNKSIENILKYSVRNEVHSRGFGTYLLTQYLKKPLITSHDRREENIDAAIDWYVSGFMSTYDYQQRVSEINSLIQWLSQCLNPKLNTDTAKRNSIKQGLSVLEGRKTREADAEAVRKKRRDGVLEQRRSMSPLTDTSP